MTDGLSYTEFDELFNQFADSPTSTTVFRWEGLQHYHVDYDEPSWRAHQDGTPWPDRSVRTDPWLARMARSTIAGKRWERVRYVEEPHTPYTAWELQAFGQSAPCGEMIGITRTADITLPDFWVFTGSTAADQYAVLMHYDEAGAPDRFEYRDDTAQLDTLWAAVDTLRESPTERLNAYLARTRRAGVHGVA